jgi:arylsulfatase A-like enzyme
VFPYLRVHWRLVPALASVALAALCLAACGGPAPEAGKPNVVFILVDTLRADHLGLYGYPRPTSPTLDAFAGDAVVFDDARSQAGCTFPSANSILTSQPPARFLGQPGGALGIPEGIATLPEILRANGWATAAVSASAVVRKRPSVTNRHGGFGRGFGLFVEDCLWKSAVCVNERAFGALDTLPRPFFLYLHYLEPHAPYRPPRFHQRRFAPRRAVQRFARRGDPNPIGRHIYAGAPDPLATPADLGHLMDLYDEEIAFFDAQLALLLAALRDRGLFEETIVVLASDHGEEFLEHGHIKHCRTVYEASIKVPLVLRVPGVPPARLAPGAENLDIVPTLLDYLGIPAAEHGFAGASLRPAIETGERVREHQFSAQGAYRAAVGPRHKLVHDLATRRAWLYDLAADPGERQDRLAAQRRAYAPLRDALREWMAHAEGGDPASSLALAEEAERRLRAVGYIE